MTNVWPLTLPTALLVQGFSEQPQDNIVRFQPEVGPAKLRRRGTAAARLIDGMLILKQSSRNVFDDFYKTTLSHGADAFYWKDPGNGPGVYAFSAPPQYSLIAPGVWRVGIQLLRYA